MEGSDAIKVTLSSFAPSPRMTIASSFGHMPLLYLCHCILLYVGLKCYCETLSVLKTWEI